MALLAISLLMIIALDEAIAQDDYYGKFLGDFKTNAHGVKGSVYAMNENTFLVKDFEYDGQGPDAYFWGDVTEVPTVNGFIVPLENENESRVLKEYKKENVIIKLPEGKTIRDLLSLSVWCRKFTVNFGHVTIPPDFIAPGMADLGALSSLAHGVRSGKVVVKDSKTIKIYDLHYDGAGPDAFFLVGTGDSPHPKGTKVPDENGSLEKMHGYNGQDVELVLPDGVSVHDIEWLALFCIAYRQNFGNVRIPRDLNVPPHLPTILSKVGSYSLAPDDNEFDNCEEMFPGVLNVRWKIDGQYLLLQLEGKAGKNEYLAFGRSGNDGKNVMIGSDVAVAYYDEDTREFQIVDYYLSSKSQCAQESGACPDTRLRGTNDAEIIRGVTSDGIYKITYRRPLGAGDEQDLSIPVSIPVSVVAAIGPLNSQKEVAFHTKYYTKSAKFIHFGRVPSQDRCGSLQFLATVEMPSWIPAKITDATTFNAQIGPTGGDKGYTSITGSQSWGIAWWINGLLIPELMVIRGVNYTFIVEGGDNPANSASYHPLYITNNPEGGGGQFLDQIGLKNHMVYAGLFRDNNQGLTPIGVGRMCEWKHLSIDKSEESMTFEDYKRTLKLQCDEGKPGVFYWTPDENTPDTVYYQCFTHRNLGWKINVVDGQPSKPLKHMSFDKNAPSIASLKTPEIFLTFVLLALFIFHQKISFKV